VNHGVLAFRVHHLLRAQPAKQLFAIGSLEDGGQGVVLMQFGPALGDHQQMQIMIAQDGDRPAAEAFDEAQNLLRVRTAVDQIADEPQAVARLIETDLVEQFPQWIVAALQIAYRVGSHVRTVTGDRYRYPVNGQNWRWLRRIDCPKLKRGLTLVAP